MASFFRALKTTKLPMKAVLGLSGIAAGSLIAQNFQNSNQKQENLLNTQYLISMHENILNFGETSQTLLETVLFRILPKAYAADEYHGSASDWMKLKLKCEYRAVASAVLLVDLMQKLTNHEITTTEFEERHPQINQRLKKYNIKANIYSNKLRSHQREESELSQQIAKELKLFNKIQKHILKSVRDYNNILLKGSKDPKETKRLEKIRENLVKELAIMKKVLAKINMKLSSSHY